MAKKMKIKKRLHVTVIAENELTATEIIKLIDSIDGAIVVLVNGKKYERKMRAVTPEWDRDNQYNEYCLCSPHYEMPGTLRCSSCHKNILTVS